MLHLYTCLLKLKNKDGSKTNSNGAIKTGT
jgi:hypothetical protein